MRTAVVSTRVTGTNDAGDAGGPHGLPPLRNSAVAMPHSRVRAMAAGHDIRGTNAVGAQRSSARPYSDNSTVQLIGMSGLSESRTEQYLVTASSTARSACTRSIPAPAMW